MGVDTAQGFLFAKAMTADALAEKLLASAAQAERAPLATPSEDERQPTENP